MAINTNIPSTPSEQASTPDGDSGSVRAQHRETFAAPAMGVSNGSIHDPGDVGAAGLRRTPVAIPGMEHPRQTTIGSAPDTN